MDINILQKKINFSNSNNLVVWKCEFNGEDIVRRKRSYSDSAVINCPACNDCLKVDSSMTLCMHFSDKKRSKSF